QQGGLSSARTSADGHHATGFDDDRDVPQHRLTVAVRDGDAIDRHGPHAASRPGHWAPEHSQPRASLRVPFRQLTDLKARTLWSVWATPPARPGLARFGAASWVSRRRTAYRCRLAEAPPPSQRGRQRRARCRPLDLAPGSASRKRVTTTRKTSTSRAGSTPGRPACRYTASMRAEIHRAAVSGSVGGRTWPRRAALRMRSA